MHKGAPFIASKDIVEVPGPGNYTPKDKLSKGRIVPSWSLSKDERDKLKTGGVPGPGEYTLPTKIGETPKYIMGLKLEPNPTKNKELEPGPASYDPIKSQKTLKYTMSAKLDGSVSPEKLTPGPGAYGDERTLYYQTLPGSKMGKDNRKSYFLKSASYEKPGPGNY